MYLCICLSCVSVYPCIHVSLCLCVSVSLCLWNSVFMCPCIHVSMYPCIHVSMYPCIHVSMYPCIRVSMYPCVCAKLNYTKLYVKTEVTNPCVQFLGRSRKGQRHRLTRPLKGGESHRVQYARCSVRAVSENSRLLQHRHCLRLWGRTKNQRSEVGWGKISAGSRPGGKPGGLLRSIGIFRGPLFGGPLVMSL